MFVKISLSNHSYALQFPTTDPTSLLSDLIFNKGGHDFHDILRVDVYKYVVQ
jgi:hypothetical protein